MDILSPERRSSLMARIKAKDTHPEMVVRRIVFGLGRRYRLHSRALPGAPDLVLARDRKIIFVHGCFWHQHAHCTVARMPKSRMGYWRPKLEGNRLRDTKNVRRLRRSGWSVLIIRECQLSDMQRTATRLAEFLQERKTKQRSEVTHTRASKRGH
jgi:DNA mismatch endonuclease (patch repair protein)